MRKSCWNSSNSQVPPQPPSSSPGVLGHLALTHLCLDEEMVWARVKEERDKRKRKMVGWYVPDHRHAHIHKHSCYRKFSLIPLWEVILTNGEEQSIRSRNDCVTWLGPMTESQSIYYNHLVNISISYQPKRGSTYSMKECCGHDALWWEQTPHWMTCGWLVIFYSDSNLSPQPSFS